MNQIRSLIIKICAVGLLLATVQIPAVIYNYSVYQHPVTGNTIYLFSDFHGDLNDLSRTMTQIEFLSKLFKAMPGPKEIIAEDPITLYASHTNKALTPSQFIKPFDSVSLPKGKNLDLVQVGILPYAVFSYKWQGIPTYNAEFRSITNDLDEARKAVLSMMQYNDTPMLNLYYNRLKVRYEALQATKDPFDKTVFNTMIDELCARLIEVRMLHRLYQNTLTHVHNQIILAGGAHIDSIIPILKALGYEQKLFNGITTPQFLTYWQKTKAQALQFIPNTMWSYFLFKLGIGQGAAKTLTAIDTLYVRFMDQITLKADEFQPIRKFWQSPNAPQKSQSTKAPPPLGIKSRL